MEFKIAKGVKDWYGKEAVLRNKIRNTLKEIFERYGYGPIETPIMENIETLGYKGGGEIQKEVFRLKDRGNRELALRFDHTVPLARFYSSHPELKLPFKRYAIGEVFRDGPTQPEQGRYRSFTQCDIDVLGIKEMTAEMEIFCLARDVFKKLYIGDVDVKINNKKVLDRIIGYAGIPETLRTRTIITIDKMDKIGVDGVSDTLKEMKVYDPPLRLSDGALQKIGENNFILENEDLRRKIITEIGNDGMKSIEEILSKGECRSETARLLDIYSNDGGNALNLEQVDKLLSIINIPGTNLEKYRALKNILPDNEGLEEIKEIIDYSRTLNLDFIKFDPSLARELDYYTGTTIEVYLKDDSLIKSAIARGGRFDNMVGDFIGKKSAIPAVGMSFGLERMVAVMEKTDNITNRSMTEIYIIPIGEYVKETLSISQELRGLGINTDMSHNPSRKIRENISYADSQGIRYVGFVGENEIKGNSITIKNLENGRQETVPLSQVFEYLHT